MSVWVYIIGERACADNNYHTTFTVGHYRPSDGKFISESDHESSDSAAARAHYLNGGRSEEDSNASREDYLHWQCGDFMEYGRFKIKPKLDMEGHKQKHGWVVVDEKGCNALPGATWGTSREEALYLLHIFIVVGGDSDRFWSLHRAISTAFKLKGLTNER